MKSRILFIAAAIMLALMVSAWAADITGKWIAEAPGIEGTVEITMDLKMTGTDLTGTLDNPLAGPTDIKDGKIEGDDVSFHVVRTIMENERKVIWKGKNSGEEIRFTRAVEGGLMGGPGGPGGGAPGGEAPPAPEIIAKRAK